MSSQVRKSLPKSIRNNIWSKYIGERFSGKCYVCSNKINVFNYECGHIVARAKGGSDSIDNLVPICSTCNKSMQTMNLREYKKKYYNSSYCNII